MPDSKPANESQRLLDLRSYEILDTPPDDAFDAIARLASQICDTPIALISLLDEERQWFKARIGLDVAETSRDVAFCGHAIMQDQLMVVGDALTDERFATNPLVLGDPNIRFYAGMPLVTPSGTALGTLCVIDRKPRSLSDDQRMALRLLAGQVVTQLELHRMSLQLRQELDYKAALDRIVRSQKELLSEVCSNVPAILFALDRSGTILMENGTRIRESDPVGKSAFDVFAERPEIVENIRRALGGESFRTMIEDHGRVMEVSYHSVPDSRFDLAVVGVALDVTEIDHLRRAVEREHLHARLLFDAAAAANAATTNEQALDAALRAICALTKWPVGHVWLRESSAPRDLASAPIWSTSPSLAGVETFIKATPRRLPADYGLPWIALRRGRALYVPDVTTDDRFVRQQKDLTGELRSGLFLPVLVNGEAEAVLEFFFPHSEPLEDSLLTVLEQVAQQIGHALRRHQIESALQQSEESLRDLVESSRDYIGTHDLHGRILSANAATAAALGAESPDELVGKLLSDFVPLQFKPDFEKYLQRVAAAGSDEGLMAVIGANGAPRIWEYRNSLRQTPGAAVVRAFARDVTDRIRLQDALSESESRYRSLFEASLAGVFQATLDGRIVEVNQACLDMLGYSSKEELLAIPALAFYPDPVMRAHMAETLQKNGSLTNFEQQLKRKDGSLLWVLVNSRLVYGDKQGPMIHGNFVDITAQRDAYERSAHLATHDPLTGLPNRVLFMDRLEHGIAQSAHSHAPLSVMFLDLDHFKPVNDRFGHAAGDEVLAEVSRRLKALVSESDTVARIGGDEFAIILAGDIDQSRLLAARIEEAVGNPIDAGGDKIQIQVSIGVAVWNGSLSAADLLRRADQEMYRAKNVGKSRT